ncbi:hypothetical protein GCM10023322_43050 [Rugosimonospora acidiphila]|uniref:Uncharacterized protein n=1 Tax=Rugosimonospora acidiphila TaxID=556531 RepID=A0ABP9S2F0_9ACTN
MCSVELRDDACCALVADPGVVDRDDPSLNGRRLLTACSPQHLAELTAAATPRTR